MRTYSRKLRSRNYGKLRQTREIGVITNVEREAHNHLLNRLTDKRKEERERKFTPPTTLPLVWAVCLCPFVLMVARIFTFVFSLPLLPPSTFAVPSSSGSGDGTLELSTELAVVVFAVNPGSMADNTLFQGTTSFDFPHSWSSPS